MTIARKQIVLSTEVGFYHCIARCVRQAYLCGHDAISGRDFGHRKGWIENRLRELASAFAVEVCSYAVMSNHLHVILRNRPDMAREWSDEEVARRWLTLFPKRSPKAGGEPGSVPEGKTTRDNDKHNSVSRDKTNPAQTDSPSHTPPAPEIAALVADKARIEKLRGRLRDVSWFMRCLNEFVARMANREDACKGRFWEGRFRCQRLLDESALLTCMAYVDLNPVRAGVATAPENARFTSGFTRARAVRARARLKAAKHANERPAPRQEKTWRQEAAAAQSDRWLAPLASDGRAYREGRAILNLSAPSYLELLDWTGRTLRADKRGAIPAELLPILERMQIDAARWVRTIERYGGLFHRVAGRLEHMVDAAQRAGQRWFCGVGASRAGIFEATG